MFCFKFRPTPENFAVHPVFSEVLTTGATIDPGGAKTGEAEPDED